MQCFVELSYKAGQFEINSDNLASMTEASQYLGIRTGSSFYLGYWKNFEFVSVVQDLMKKKKKISYTDGGRGQKLV